MVKTPLGQFSRSRRDWNVEGLKYSAGQNGGSGNSLVAIFSLNNNSNDGSPLAVFGIWGWYTSPRAMMVAWPQQGLSGGNNGTDMMLKTDVPSIGGFVNVATGTTVGLPTSGLVFRADGSTWLSNHDAPLFIIPVNWRLVVIGYEPTGLFTPGAMSAAAFLYGQYSTGTSPRVTAAKRPVVPQ